MEFTHEIYFYDIACLHTTIYFTPLDHELWKYTKNLVLITKRKYGCYIW